MINNSRMKGVGVLIALCAAIVLWCVKNLAQDECAKLPRIADYPCACGEVMRVMTIVTNEVIATEDIGKRYEVQTHHYYPIRRFKRRACEER